MVFSPQLIWFLIGVVFLIVEFFIPGFIFIFFTAGAWIAGLSVWLFDYTLTTQIVVFIITSLVLLFLLRKYSMETFKGSKRESVDDHYADSKIGQKAIVSKDILADKVGEIKVGGSFWMAVADNEIKAGESVIIEGQDTEDGLTFRVKQV